MISIIFSFYNEEETLPILIGQVRKVMAQEGGSYELIFVNDDSTDGSVAAITGKGKVPGEDIVIVNMSRRFGVEESFMAGLQTARGEAMILMYTDMQDPPETIREMLAKWRQGADVVHTIRRERVGEHPAKKIAAHIAYKWISRISDIKIPRDAGEFKLLSRRAAVHVCQFSETEPYLRGLIPWVGFKQDSVLYDLMPRTIGKSKVALFGKKALKVFLSGLISFSSFPIYAILFASLFGFCAFLAVVVFQLLADSGSSPAGHWAAFALLLWSTLMFALGIVGIYVLKIYQNTTKRPLYIVKDIIR